MHVLLAKHALCVLCQLASEHLAARVLVDDKYNESAFLKQINFRNRSPLARLV